MTFDFNTFINASVILTANITSVTCSNIKTGQAGQISYIQDGSGSHTAVYCSQFRFAGATTPTLTTSASAVDVMSFGPCRSSSWCPAALLKGFNP